MQPIHLAAGDLRLTVLPLGAAIQSLHLQGVAHSLVLGHADPEAYRTARGYLGAVVGRVANRIVGGRLMLDGTTYQLDRNEGPNTLHGGTDGFHRRAWQVAEVTADTATLDLTSPDGDQGFPGTLRVRCRYRLLAPATLAMDLDATTDAPTVVSLAQHVYWNLDGRGTIDGHMLHVRAEHVLATDEARLPTVVQPAPSLGCLRHREIDANFCLAEGVREAPEMAAALAAGGVRMELATTEPGLQVYTGERLPDPFHARQGLCLEPQGWPNAANRPDFPSVRLDPGQAYRQRTTWTFTRTGEAYPR